MVVYFLQFLDLGSVKDKNFDSKLSGLRKIMWKPEVGFDGRGYFQTSLTVTLRSMEARRS